MMEFLQNYLDNVYQTPDSYYRDLTQQTLSAQFDNTTQLRTIKEQSYPFSDIYTEYEAQINSVSDISVNTNKNVVDFIRVFYKDVNHTLNHRGQKYLYKPDGTSENTYLCYDKMNALTQVPDFKCVRCNNHLTWLDINGNIVKEPCYIGEEISATNNQVTKDATVPQRRLVCMVQGNSNTTNIKLNQRFILSHKQAFKITEMNVYSQDDSTSEDVTLYTFYIEWSTLLNTDNTEYNLADYYKSNYTLQIDQSDLSIQPNSIGQLTSTTTLNGNIITTPLTWVSSNTSVATIDENGNYTIVGLSGTTCTMTCTIKGNEQVADTITISVESVPTSIKVLTVMPNEISNIKLNTTKQIYYGVYINGVKQSDIVTVSLSGATSDCYSKVDIIDGVEIKCLKTSSTPLQITFSSGSLTKTMSIALVGIM